MANNGKVYKGNVPEGYDFLYESQGFQAYGKAHDYNGEVFAMVKVICPNPEPHGRSKNNWWVDYCVTRDGGRYSRGKRFLEMAKVVPHDFMETVSSICREKYRK